MKINRKEFLGALELASKVPVYKGGLPVFDNVYLSMDLEKLIVICSDYEVRMETSVPCQLDEGESWSCLVNRKLLIQTIKAMYDEEITITFSDAYVLNIKGNEAKIQLPGNNAAGFPEKNWKREEEINLWGLTHEHLSRFLPKKPLTSKKYLCSKCRADKETIIMNLVKDLSAFYEERREYINEDLDHRFLLAITGDLKKEPNSAHICVNGLVGNIKDAMVEVAMTNKSYAALFLEVAARLVGKGYILSGGE